MAVGDDGGVMDVEDRDEAVAFLRHVPVLAACRDGPLTRRNLVEATGTSRTTVYRATVALEEDGLLEHTSEGYRTTPRGEAMSTLSERYLEGMDAIERLTPLFDVVSHPELIEHAHLLVDADITVADESDPYRASDRALELWSRSECVRGALTARGSRYSLMEGTRAAFEGEMSVELCFTPDALPRGDELDADTVDAIRLSKRFQTFVADEIPFSFALHDDVATVVGHNDVGVPSVLVESTTPVVRRWLETLYDDCRRSAVSVEDETAG